MTFIKEQEAFQQEIYHSLESVPSLGYEVKISPWVGPMADYLYREGQSISRGLWESLVEKSHGLTFEHDREQEPVEHKFLKAAAIRSQTLDTTGLCPNGFDVANTPQEMLDLVTGVTAKHVDELLHMLPSWNVNAVESFLDGSKWSPTGAYWADFLHERIISDLRTMRGPKAQQFHSVTETIGRQYRAQLNILYHPVLHENRVVAAEQTVPILPIPHATLLNPLIPEAFFRDTEIEPNILDPIWVARQTGKAGAPLSIIVARAFKKFVENTGNIPLGQDVVDAMDEFIRSHP